jgi:hypothetical protein
LLRRANLRITVRYNHVDFHPNKFGGYFAGAFGRTLGQAIFDDKILTLDPAEFAEPLRKSTSTGSERCLLHRSYNSNDWRLLRLLRARR